ncbi:YoaK family protein [Neobacillus sp. OS1-2]|uniref:YoaK family protein n=1 Tax=Neobacillus sp. OS1-2 TaxID=3070680 RepID=UPI0027DF5260|nr:YoaK family protein [Neobacillus sp. OS1-2]WML42072.1 YoaK family protein [Neobacillus sp. OS1-2]
MIDKQKKIPSLASNSVRLAVLLAIVGGFLDAYTFVSRDGVFANAQTGNIVLFAVKVANGEWKSSLLYIVPISAFILGVLVSEVVKLPQIRQALHSYRRSILILECVVLVVVGILPSGAPNLAVTVSISFVSSLQISTFNKLDKWAYNSTMTTGNLRTATQAAYAAFIEHNPEAKKKFKEFNGIILSFLFGALTGTVTTTYIGNASIWIASGFLVIALVLYHRDRGYIRSPITLK